MTDLILAIDQGTSSTKACLFEPPGKLVAAASVPVDRHTPEPGAVEQDPEELATSCTEAATDVLREAGVAAADLAGCALANTGETFMLYEAPAAPVTQAIGWQDARADEVVEEIAAQGAEERIIELTGLPLHAEFTAPKLATWLRRVGGRDGLRFGTIDSWIVARLDPNRPHVTDRATASRTMLIGLEDDDWNEELCQLFGVPREILPEIRPGDGMEASLEITGTEVPLLGSGYDMGLALLGHGCFEDGETKATFGTCLGVMTATGARIRRAPGLLSAIAYGPSWGRAFALDGEIAAAGSLIRWALGAGIASSLGELEAAASAVPSSAGVIVVPALTGLGAPHWRDDVTGRIIGLTEAAGRGELAHAIFDAIAFSLRDVVEAIRDADLRVDELRVDGGLTNSEYLMRRCADACGIPLLRAGHQEATAYGAAALAMLGAGVANEEEIRTQASAGANRIEPEETIAEAELDAWGDAVAEALHRSR